MHKHRIVHIINNDKFIKSFIYFMENNFDKREHLFVFTSGESKEKFPIPKSENIVNINNLFLGIKNINKLSKSLNILLQNAEKIILHNIFSGDLINYLYFHRSFLTKCYWVMWGEDLYAHLTYKKNLKHILGRYRKKVIIPNMAGIITYIKGDYQLAQKCYGATGKYYECLMYPSNLYQEHNIKPKEHKTINIQIGNSANPSNNHFEVFEKLKKYKDEDIMVITPLSYGDEEHAKEVIDVGMEIFGDKFKPLTEFMPFDKYLELLADIDIAIFNHKRQQAMGNTITLLGLGKKVYIRSDATPWQMFETLSIKVFDTIKKIDIDLMDEDIQQKNRQRIKDYFSEEKFKTQLTAIFEG